MVTSGPSSSRLCGLQCLQPQPACPTHESVSTPPPAPCCGCHRPCGAAMGPGGRLSANQEPPWPRSSSEPAEPAEEARPAGGPRLPRSAGPPPPHRQLLPQEGPHPKKQRDQPLQQHMSSLPGAGRGHSQPWSTFWPPRKEPFRQRAQHKAALCPDLPSFPCLLEHGFVRGEARACMGMSASQHPSAPA